MVIINTPNRKNILIYKKNLSVFQLQFFDTIITIDVIPEEHLTVEKIQLYPQENLCYSKDEKQWFFFNWAENATPVITITLQQIMIEVLHNRQNLFLAETLYDIDNSFFFQIGKIVLALITIILWSYILGQMVSAYNFIY